jgi:hypothetical protein
MRYALFLFILLSSLSLQSQELVVTVKVIAPSATKTDPIIFNNLEVAIKEFYNNTRWTSDNFEDNERINASVQLTIKEEVGLNTFNGELIVQSSRPVFNSSYNTPMVNIFDRNISFTYNNFQPIEKSDNRYVDNLSSILTYYAYIILGFDYDSFSPNGGDPFFKLAQNTMNLLPNSLSNGDRGWNQNSSDRNRFWLIENLFNPRMRKVRLAYFDYHLAGLDKMAENADLGRTIILSTMNAINDANTTYPNSYLLNMIVDAKSSELIEMFKVSDKNQRGIVYNALVKVDPSNASRYGILK